MTYDWRADAAGSYDAAITALRRRKVRAGLAAGLPEDYRPDGTLKIEGER